MSWLDQIRNLFASPKPAPIAGPPVSLMDPGTKLLNSAAGAPYEQSLVHLLLQAPEDPSRRPVFSSHPLNLTKQQRVKLGQKEGKEYKEEYALKLRKDWLAKAKEQSSGVPDALFDFPAAGEDRWTNIVGGLNKIQEMQERLDAQVKAGQIPPKQAAAIQSQMDRYRNGFNAQIDTLRKDMIRDVLKEIKVLSGKRQL